MGGMLDRVKRTKQAVTAAASEQCETVLVVHRRIGTEAVAVATYLIAIYDRETSSDTERRYGKSTVERIWLRRRVSLPDSYGLARTPVTRMAPSKRRFH